MTKENTSPSIGASLISFTIGLTRFPLAILIFFIVFAQLGWLFVALAHFLGHTLDTYMRGDELWRTKVSMYSQLVVTFAWWFWHYHCQRTSTSNTRTAKVLYSLFPVLSGLVTLWWLAPELARFLRS
jgi:hypothetical protein